MRSAQEEGNMDNVAHDNGGGISMVHRCGLKNLLMVKVRALEILKLRTTRKKWAKDIPTKLVLYLEVPYAYLNVPISFPKN
jgi:hypothetical protein